MRAIATHELSLRTVGDFFSLQFGLVGFVLLPVVLSGVALTAWRGYRHREPVAILLSTAVIVPFAYFFWKSLTLAGRRHLADVLLAGRICRRRHQHRDAAARRVCRNGWSNRRFAGRGSRSLSGIAFVVGVFLYYVAAPWNLIGRTDPVGGEAGYEQVAARAQDQLKRTGATWIATTDYRTYAMMRWHFNGRVPVMQINERGRFQGFRDPGMNGSGIIPAFMLRASPTTASRCGIETSGAGSRSNGSSEAGAAS